MARHEDASTRAEHDPGLTRRSVLQRAGLVVAAAAALPSCRTRQPAPSGAAAVPQAVAPAGPNQLSRAEAPISDVMTRLSTYMSEARGRTLPDEVLERAKRHLLDTIAAMVSGSDLVPGRAAVAFARAYGGKELATVVGDTMLIGPIEAALVNGVLAHADETDDYGPVGSPTWHPGSVVVPAALAAGEQFGINGAHFLRAMVLGYDVGSRILMTVAPGLANSYTATYPLGGVFAAAAAAGCAAGLTPEQTRWMLSYAAQQCAGMTVFARDPDHVQKGFMFAGMPARSGVTAALVVHTGWTGVGDVFSGTDNFLLDYGPTESPAVLVEKLGERFDVMRMNLKRWTVGAPIQEPLEAMQALLKQQPIDPNQVQDIVVRSAPGSITDNSGPVDINLQHALAVMLIDRAVTFRSIHDKARMNDPAILRLRAKVRLQPPGTNPPVLQITLTNGTRLTQDRVEPGVLGVVANPMSRDQVVAKARELMTPALGAANCSTLIDRVLSLEKVQDIKELRPLLQRTPGSGSPTLSEYPNAT